MDPRTVAARALAMGGEALPPNHWVMAVSPGLDLPDGRTLMWHPPQPVAFNLIQAKRHRDRGARLRRSLLGNLKARPEEATYMPRNSSEAFDCLGELSAAVLFAFTAVESAANHAIEVLPDGVSVKHRGEEVLKRDMTRLLGIETKLKRVLPQVEHGRHIAGNAEVWSRFGRLKFLRDELLHVKDRGYSPDPKQPTPYDRLLLGEADDCVEDARAVVEAAWPGFLPEYVTDALA